MHEVILAGPIGLQVFRFQRYDLIGLGDIRKLREHVRLDASQIHGSEAHPHFRRCRPNLLQERHDLRVRLGLYRRYQHMEFAQSVLQSRTRHECYRARDFAELTDRLGPLGGRVLDRMGFVDGQQVDRGDLIRQPRQSRISRDSDSALALPLLQLVVPIEAMDDDGAEFGVLLHLTLPVHEHAVRRDHEEVTFPLCSQMTHRRQDLNRLTQTHVVAEQHPLLADHVLGAEDLILAQIGGHQAQVQARRFDRIGDLRRQAATEVRSGQNPLGDHAGRQDALQQSDETGGVIAIASPDHLWRKRQTLGVVRQTSGFLGHPAQFRGQITIPSSQLLLGRDREEMIPDLRLAPEDP